MANYMQYVPRVIRSPSNRSLGEYCDEDGSGPEFEAAVAQMLVPAYHLSSQRSWPTTQIVPGDVIWLVSQVRSPWGSLPPSLDARINVKEVRRPSVSQEGYGTEYVAGSGSTWFPLADATELLSSIGTVKKDSSVVVPYRPGRSHIGQAFQSIRKLSSSAEVDAWVSSIAARPLEFVSYRIHDGTQRAFDFVLSRMNAQAVVFWDRWSLPRRLSERGEWVDPVALDNHIHRQMQSADLVWGVPSPSYGAEGTYSKQEWDLAVKLGLFRWIPS